MDQMINKAGYTANTSRWRVGRGGNARFHTFKLDHHGPTDGRTDGQSLLQSRLSATKKYANKSQRKQENCILVTGNMEGFALSIHLFYCWHVGHAKENKTAGRIHGYQTACGWAGAVKKNAYQACWPVQ